MLKISKIASIACYLYRPRKMDTFITVLLKSKLIQPLKYTYTVNQKSKSINFTNGNTQIHRHIPGYSRMFTEVLFKMTNNLENIQTFKCQSIRNVLKVSQYGEWHTMRQIILCSWNVKKQKKQIHSKNELIYKTEIESQM